MSGHTTFQVAMLLTAAFFVAGCGESSAPAARESGGAREENTQAPKASSESSSENPSSEANTPGPPPRDVILDKTFDDVKFEMEKGAPFQRELVGPAIEGMKKQRIRIRGYMLPGFQQSGITQFVLVRDNMECCFGPGAALFDCILIDMDPGKSVEFSIRPVTAVGIFDIQVIKGPDGYPLAIYHLQASEVK